METITISIRTDTFETDKDVAQALRDLADRIETQGVDGVSHVLDANGQTVGSVSVEDDDEFECDEPDPGAMDGDHTTALESVYGPEDWESSSYDDC